MDRPELGDQNPSMSNVVAREEELALLFTAARTHFAWLPDPVHDDLLRRVYDLARWAPTGSNAQPLRVVFAKSAEAKERLRPALAPMNVEKVMTAPATAILAYDARWYDQMPKLVPFREGVREQLLALPRLPRLDERRPASRLLHPRGTCVRSRLRSDRRLRSGEGRRRVLSRRCVAHDPSDREPRTWRSAEDDAAHAEARLRLRVPHRVRCVARCALAADVSSSPTCPCYSRRRHGDSLRAARAASR